MLLRLKNIGKIYNSNDILTIGIRGINLGLDYNEFVTIEGESGSGKSTLLNVIGANDGYEEGELYINGGETSHYTESEWEKYREKNIATVFQDFNIIENLTVVENVELALLRIEDKKKRREIARELIAKVGLEKQANQRGSRLSGGEKQRTVIARALAKDAPIILADEPTGNLDMKSSREVAKLLKEVSKDKLVIVVTHNPEFFEEYATRRVKIFDGSVKEDKVISKPAPKEREAVEEAAPSKKRDFKNTLHIGILNYKSRPKFTAMMSFALFVCAVTLFMILNIFTDTLIQPITAAMEDTVVEGKIIISSSAGNISGDELDAVAAQTNAGYVFMDLSYTAFEIGIAKSGGMSSAYTVTCLYAPYDYLEMAGEATLVMPASNIQDGQAVAEIFLNAGVGIETVTIETSLTSKNVLLYVSYDDLMESGVKMTAINSSVRIAGTDISVYTFAVGAELESGEVSVVNSVYWDILGKTVVFSAMPKTSYTVADDSEKDESVSGVVILMNESDYREAFGQELTSGNRACLYFSTKQAAQSALEKINGGYLGLLSADSVYVRNAGETFLADAVYYAALIAVCLLLAMLISVIFSRSVKIFRADFAVYRTLGIAERISSRSLYVQMSLIFLPTLVLLPLISLAAAYIPWLGFTLIGIGNYLFLELMLLFIVELVAFGFNKSLAGKSIRKSLVRGSK